MFETICFRDSYFLEFSLCFSKCVSTMCAKPVKTQFCLEQNHPVMLLVTVTSGSIKETWESTYHKYENNVIFFDILQ